ncbi:MAG: S28 family serine protease, partial [Kofleriaceae bacterium]
MLRPFLAACVVLAACGDDGPAPVGPSGDEVLARLRALDGVTAAEEPTSTPGMRYFVAWFTQPVDHEDPGGQTFQQRVSLLHHDGAAPMIALTSGYWDFYQDYPDELTQLLDANQISIEHRFFGQSRPDPADWSKLTIRQMADDQHHIIAALRTIYPGAFVTTGASKGGMTATYHRRFYPDDVEGTVPYVAPLSFEVGDPRYAVFLDAVGPSDCRAAVRAVATEMLQNRRAELREIAEAQATQQGYQYTRVALDPALESAIVSLEWSFWQYYGIEACASVPRPAASDLELWRFLDQISPVSDNDDTSIGLFDAYYYQAAAQLGAPAGGAAYLEDYLMYSDADYAGIYPTALPAYDGGAAMRDIDAFVQQGERWLFVYGEWDPWTAGAYQLGAATDSLLLTQARGDHGSEIRGLAPADRALAFAKLAAWTGVDPREIGNARRRAAVDRPRP